MVFAKVRSKGNAKERLDKIKAATKGHEQRLRAGFPKGKTDSFNLNKAIWNEFGTVNIPERPFMRNTVAKKKSIYKRHMRKAASQIMAGSSTIPVVLNKLGILVQGDIQGEITSLNSPPNAPSTIRQKGSSNPLIDTSAMRQAVTWEVK